MLCVFKTTSIKKCKLNYTYMSTSLVYCPKLYNSNCWQLKFTCEIQKVSYFSIRRQKDERLYHFSEHGTIIVIRWKVSQSFYVPQIWKEFLFVNFSGVNQIVVSGNSSFIWSGLPWFSLNYYLELRKGFPGGSVGKESACSAGDAGDVGSIPGLERVPGGGNGKALQCSWRENPMDRGAWWATVLRVAKSWIQLKRLNTLAQSWENLMEAVYFLTYSCIHSHRHTCLN